MQPEDDKSHVTSNVDDRRQSARLPQDQLLVCNLGEIHDLSKTGMRLRSKGMPKLSAVVVSITDGTDKVQFHAEIVWAKKKGFRSYDMGLHFTELDQRSLAIISRFAMYNRYIRSM